MRGARAVKFQDFSDISPVGTRDEVVIAVLVVVMKNIEAMQVSIACTAWQMRWAVYCAQVQPAASISTV